MCLVIKKRKKYQYQINIQTVIITNYKPSRKIYNHAIKNHPLGWFLAWFISDLSQA